MNVLVEFEKSLKKYPPIAPNRYAIRDRTPGIKQEADGSTILYLQSTLPSADKESNWLPMPK